MGKVLNGLKEQLKTDYKKDAEDCIKIYNKLKEIDGHVWGTDWGSLTKVKIAEKYPYERRHKPTQVGYIFLNGINTTTFCTNSSLNKDNK